MPAAFPDPVKQGLTLAFCPSLYVRATIKTNESPNRNGKLMADNKKVELKDEQLEDATGGFWKWEYEPQENDVYDSRGRVCGRRRSDGIYYWPCMKCKRPMHLGNHVAQCDKCSDWFIVTVNTRWGGTEEELIAASDAN